MSTNGSVRKMVKQVTAGVAVQPPEKPKRRTSHGIICECGSEDVEVMRTVDLARKYPAFISQGKKVIRRYCKCHKCGKTFNQSHEVTTRRLN